MKAIELAAPRTFRQIDIQQPGQPGPHEALVRSHVMGICGTDISCFLGKFPFFRYPGIPGHELGVEILATGANVTHIRPGDRCSVEPYLNCGTCHACRRGASNCCVDLKVLGVMTHGGLCDQFLIRADKLHVSRSLTYRQLALVETLAIGYHANARGRAGDDDQLLVIGAGPIGLASLEFARLSGACVSVMDQSPDRLEFCREKFGVQNLIHWRDEESARDEMQRITGGDYFQVVIDATGNRQSMQQAPAWVAPTGTLVYVGITSDTLEIPHPLIHRPELEIRASRNALPADFREIIGLLETDQLTIDPWITHQFPFDEFIARFPALTDSATGAIKAIVEIQPTA